MNNITLKELKERNPNEPCLKDITQNEIDNFIKEGKNWENAGKLNAELFNVYKSNEACFYVILSALEPDIASDFLEYLKNENWKKIIRSFVIKFFMDSMNDKFKDVARKELEKLKSRPIIPNIHDFIDNCWKDLENQYRRK